MTWSRAEADQAVYEEEHGVEVELICIDPFCGNVWVTVEFEGECLKAECDCGMPGRSL